MPAHGHAVSGADPPPMAAWLRCQRCPDNSVAPDNILPTVYRGKCRDLTAYLAKVRLSFCGSDVIDRRDYCFRWDCIGN